MVPAPAPDAGATDLVHPMEVRVDVVARPMTIGVRETMAAARGTMIGALAMAIVAQTMMIGVNEGIIDGRQMTTGVRRMTIVVRQMIVDERLNNPKVPTFRDLNSSNRHDDRMVSSTLAIRFSL